MHKLLPDYCPPNTQRASLAVGVAPILVLLTFTLVVVRWMPLDLALAVFAACTAWVVYEMHVYQATIDGYNEDYVSRHLAWRSNDALQAMTEAPDTPESTRSFVCSFIDAQRVLLRDGQVP